MGRICEWGLNLRIKAWKLAGWRPDYTQYKNSGNHGVSPWFSNDTFTLWELSDFTMLCGPENRKLSMSNKADISCVPTRCWGHSEKQLSLLSDPTPLKNIWCLSTMSVLSMIYLTWNYVNLRPNRYFYVKENCLKTIKASQYWKVIKFV